MLSKHIFRYHRIEIPDQELDLLISTPRCGRKKKKITRYGRYAENEKLFFVRRVYIQDRDINSFEIRTISGDEAEWTVF